MKLPRYNRIDIDPALVDRLLATAHKAADAAAIPTLAHFRQPVLVENKLGDAGYDPVTIADKQAEEAIHSVIRDEFPAHGFFGEESERQVVDDQLLWVVDPIDGTRAFITGVPLWGTLIGLYDGADVVVGVLDQPHAGERFVGTAFSHQPASSHLISHGASRSLSCRQSVALKDALVRTTTPDVFTSPLERLVLERMKDASAQILYGGDCYCYALLAMGFCDVVIETGLQPYDVAALVPIVRGAGGVMTNWQGGSAADGGSVLVCASTQLHDSVLELINAC